MAVYTGSEVANTFKSILNVSNDNTGLTSSLKTVQTAEGTDSKLQLSTTAVNIISGFELNGTAITPTGVELNYVDGVTSAIQTQLDTKTDVSGTPIANDYARFTDANTVAGRSYTEVKQDLSLDNVTNVATSDVAYNATSWDTNTDAATKNAIRDKVVSIDSAVGSNTTHRTSDGSDHSFLDQPVVIAGSPTFVGLTLSGAIATPTNISMTGELDLTGTGALIDLNPSGTGSANIIDITPTGAIATTEIWNGLNIDGSALDPSGIEVEIDGLNLDFSGVSEASSPLIHAIHITVPFGQDAIHIVEGRMHFDTTLPSTAASKFTGLSYNVDSSSLVATSSLNVLEVSTTGTPSGELHALHINPGVIAIHQDIATFSTPSQTEFAGVKHTGGATWVDGIDAYGVIFVADDDAIFVGSAVQFSAIEVIMTTGASKSIQPTFSYSTGATTWLPFFPDDETDGFQESGDISWELLSISGTWTGDGDPGVGETTAGYWIRIERTRNGTVGSPDPATVKIALTTEYWWDESGDLSVNGLTTTGITLGSGSITMTGSIATTTNRATKGWFTDLQVTNAIAGSITGQAATVATIAGLAPDTATTQATQAAITSLGTLSTLSVDNILLNGNDISSTSGTLTFNVAADDEDTHFSGTAANLLYLDAGNNRVGIGIATPGTTLDVRGSGVIIRMFNDGTTDRGVDIEADNDVVIFNTLTSGSASPIAFQIGATEKMRINVGDVTMKDDFIVEGTTVNMVTSGTTLTVGVGVDNGTVSAGVFTDRTPFYDGDALADIKKIKGVNGRIDHKTLPKFVQVELKKTTERNIGNMISVNVKALQQLIERVEVLESA